MQSLPHTWPEATLAIALVTLVSYLVADVVALIGSLDVVLGEVA